MSLVLEDGTGLIDSTSLVSVEEVRAFAASRGGDLPAADADLEELIVRAHDYVLAREERIQGFRLKVTQALPFPRIGVFLYGRYLRDGTIPRTLKAALSQLVLEAIDLGDTIQSRSTAPIIQETVGPISTKYASGGVGSSFDPQPSMPRVDAFLNPIFTAQYLQSLRV